MSVRWVDRAFVLHNSEDPLEDQTGHFTNEPGGVLAFHAWDVNGDAYAERVAAGPGVMPSQRDFDLEAMRESGRRAMIEREEAALAALLDGVPARL